MKYLKLLSIPLILFFNHNLLSQVSFQEATPEYKENLSLDLYVFSADFYVGYKEIRRKDFRKIIKKNPIAHRAYLSGVRIRTFGAILGSSSVMVIGTTFGLTAYGLIDRWVLPTSIATLAVGGIFYSIGRSRLRKSVEIYNQKNDYGFKFGFNENGVGVVLNF